MTPVRVVARALAARYGPREVFHDVGFDLAAGRSLGIIGASGAGKTTLLRIVAGLLTPSTGDLRISGLPPRAALTRPGVAYFAGEATLPGSVAAQAWARLARGGLMPPERGRIRTLSRGTRQLLGLRTVLARPHAGVVALDEPWESLDPDASRWLSATLATRRDRGAAVILSSHRLHDLAGLCDAYLFLMHHQGTLLMAHDIAPVGPVTAALLLDRYDQLLGGVRSPV